MGTQAKASIGPLTSFRFFAAMGVVIHHFFGSGGGIPAGSRLDLLSIYGNLGVPFFFMLSGYILTHSYASTLEKAASLDNKQFWWKRLARIYPLFLLCLLIDIPRAVIHSSASHGMAGSAFRLAPTFVACGLMLQAWSPYLMGEWNHPSWSLSAEAFFYLLFPILSLRLAWPSDRAWKPAVVKSSGLLLAGCLMMGLSGYFASRYPKATLQYDPAGFLPLFVMGIVLYRIEQLIRRQGKKASNTLNAICSVFVLAGIADLIANYELAPGIREAGACLFFLGLIVLGRGGPSWFVRPLSWPVLLLLGEASYAVYLLQFPLVYYFQKLWDVCGLEQFHAGVTGSKVTFHLVYTVILIATSIVLFKFLETPARRFLQSRYPWSLRPLQEPIKAFSVGQQDWENSRQCIPTASVPSTGPE